MSRSGMQTASTRTPLSVAALAACLLLSMVRAGPQQSAPGSGWKSVEDAMGRSGTMMGDVIRFGMPRKDLHVMVQGTAIRPGLALGSWAAFKKMDKDAMGMGDLVLTEEEIEPVMRKLQGGWDRNLRDPQPPDR
jgi:hypothetical protein